MTEPEPDSKDSRYDEWPMEAHDAREMNYLGLVSNGAPYFYHADSGTVYQGRVDNVNQRLRLEEDVEHDIEPGKALGDAIESIGERTGWESLSEFAQEHFPDEEGEENTEDRT
jgi:hypothetical protein